MATNTLVPMAEYLSTMYRPDCDYIDGEVQERNWGDHNHSDIQSQLIVLLLRPENKAYIRANSELRVQVKPTRFRVPDVCVRRRSAPSERFVRQPPLLCIEVLSPEDTVRRVRERVRDFLEMGVPEVWVVDPEMRNVTIYNGETIVEHTAGVLAVPETPVVLALSDIFQVLDEYEQ